MSDDPFAENQNLTYMKNLLNLLLASVVIILISGSLPLKKGMYIQRYFQFVGSDGNDLAEITDPLKYQSIVITPPCPGVKDKICYIKVKYPDDVYPSGSGAKTSLPKVDLDESGRSLRSKIWNAAWSDIEFHDATLEIEIYLRN